MEHCSEDRDERHSEPEDKKRRTALKLTNRDSADDHPRPEAVLVSADVRRRRGRNSLSVISIAELDTVIESGARNPGINVRPTLTEIDARTTNTDCRADPALAQVQTNPRKQLDGFTISPGHISSVCYWIRSRD